MSSVKRASAAGALPLLARVLGLAAIAAAAGCSADVTRFGLLGDGWSATPPSSAAGYAPTGRGYRTGSYSGGFGLQETSLPPARQQHDSRQPHDYRVVGRDYPRAPATRAAPPTWQAKAPDRAPTGWTERTPRRWVAAPPLWTDRDPAPWKKDAKPLPWPDSSAAKPRAEPFPWPDGSAAKREAEPSPTPRSAFQGHYTMKRGDSLRRIARHYKVSLAELKRVNGIADATRVRVGTVLAIPERTAAAPASAPAPVAPRVVQAVPTRALAPPQPERSLAPAPERRTAARHDTKDDALPRPAVTDGKFRWPARGRIITRFGTQPDGSKSEGINLAVPMGTDIHAAEAGRVHYVGDGLKGYGNLILIRHANGWVSAYAHADRTLVKVGDEVKRGQVIGKAGKSGPVAQPQLRFELRKGSVPVDPLPHLAG